MERFFVSDDDRRVARSGNRYAVLTLRRPDGTGLEARLWDGDVEELAGRVVEMELRDRPFRGRTSWIVTELRVPENQEWRWEPPSDVFRPPRDHGWYVSELSRLLESIEDPELASVCNSLIRGHWDGYITSPAASSIHNAYIGGLLLHSVQSALLGMHLCEVYGRFFPVLRRDLVLAGCLLHDWGKMFEYETDPGSGSFGGRTEAMVTAGHISLGIQGIARLYPGSDPLPQTVSDLIHCVQSHHLIREWGSPTVPALPEAMLVAYADHTDGRLHTAADLLRNNPGRDIVDNPWDAGSVVRRQGEPPAGDGRETGDQGNGY